MEKGKITQKLVHVAIAVIMMLSLVAMALPVAADGDATQKWTGVNRYALLIAIEDYQNIGDLNYTIDDLVDIHNRLTNNCGFTAPNITALTDSAATKSAIQAAIANLAATAGANDLVVIAFSGHGGHCGDIAPMDETDTYDEFLCPWDAVSGNASTMILDDELETWLSALTSQQQAVFIDSCYSGGMTKGIKSIGPKVEIAKGDGFAKDIAATNRVVLMASDDDESSWEGPTWNNGVFTYYLVEALGTAGADTRIAGNGWVSAEEAFEYLAPRVTAAKDTQHPQISDGFSGDLDLSYMGRDATPPVTTKTVGNPKDREFITSNTPITLKATDVGEGVQYIHYEIWWDSNNDGHINTILTRQDVYADTVTFKIPRECLHEIRWYAVDNVDNVEQAHSQQHRVDNSPPVTTKTVGSPSWEDGFIVTTDTEITLTAVDQKAPCAVGVSRLFYQMWWDSNENNRIDTGDTMMQTGVPGDTVTVSFGEECLHQINWIAHDLLGNSEKMRGQRHAVLEHEFDISKDCEELIVDGETTVTVTTTPPWPGKIVQLSLSKPAIANGDRINGMKSIFLTLGPDGKATATLKAGPGPGALPYTGAVIVTVCGVSKSNTYTVDRLYIDVTSTQEVLTRGGDSTVSRIIITNPTGQFVNDAEVTFFIHTASGTTRIAYYEPLTIIGGHSTNYPYYLSYEVQGREYYLQVVDSDGNIVHTYGPFEMGEKVGPMEFDATLYYHNRTQVENDKALLEIVSLTEPGSGVPVAGEIINFKSIAPDGTEYTAPPFVSYPWDEINYSVRLANPSDQGEITYWVDISDPYNLPWTGPVTLPASGEQILDFVIPVLWEGEHRIEAFVHSGDADLHLTQVFEVVMPHATFSIENLRTGETENLLDAIRGDQIAVHYDIDNPGSYALGDNPGEPSGNMVFRVTTPEGSEIVSSQGMLLIDTGQTTLTKIYDIPDLAELGVYNVHAAFQVGQCPYDGKGFVFDVDEVRLANLDNPACVACCEPFTISFDVTRVGPVFDDQFGNSLLFAPALRPVGPPYPGEPEIECPVPPYWHGLIGHVESIQGDVAVLQVLFSTEEIAPGDMVAVSFPCGNLVPEWMTECTRVVVYYKPGDIDYSGSLPIILGRIVGKTFELDSGETKTVSITGYAPSDFCMHFFKTYVNVFLTNEKGDIWPYSVCPCCHGNDYLRGYYEVRPEQAIKVDWVRILGEKCEPALFVPPPPPPSPPPGESKFYFHKGEVVKVQVGVTNIGKYEDTKTLTVGINYKLCCLEMYPIPMMTKNVEVTVPGRCDCEDQCEEPLVVEEFNFVIPEDMPCGYYSVMAFIHPFGPLLTQQELFLLGLEPCEQAWDGFKVGYGELIVEDVTVNPETVYPGEAVTAEVTVKNIGELDASGYKLKLFVQGPTRTNIDTKVDIGIIHPGECKVVTYTFVNTGELCDHTVWAEVESYGLACPIQVSPGANMILETTPVGDDIILGVIESGPDGVLQTVPVNDDRKVTVDFEAGVGIELDEYCYAWIYAYGEIHIGGTAEFILPGANMILDTVPAGDDAIMGMILPGANYALDTLSPAGDDVVIACQRNFVINSGGDAAFAVILPPPLVSIDPIAPSIGDEVTITGVFTNPGPVPVNVPVQLMVFTPMGTPFAPFGTVIVVPKNGGEAEASFTFTVDYGGDWSYEYSGAHNVVPGSFHVALGPELEITDIAQPSLVNVGEDVDIHVSVENSGDAPGSDTLRLAITKVGETEPCFTGERAVTDLAPGDMTEGTFVYTTTEEGDYNVLAWLEEFGTPTPCSFSVYQPVPDLAITDITQPSLVNVGEDVDIDVTVKNNGDAAGSDTLLVTVTNRYTGGVVFTQDRAITNLGAGATTVESFTYTTTVEGDFDVLAVLVDSGAEITCEFYVYQPVAELIIVPPIVQPDLVCEGEEVLIKVTVKNEGDAAGGDTLRLTITKGETVVFTEDRTITNLAPLATTVESFTYTAGDGQGYFLVMAELVNTGISVPCSFEVILPQPILVASATPMEQTVGVCIEPSPIITVTVENTGTLDAHHVIVFLAPPPGVDRVPPPPPIQDIPVGESRDYTLIVHPTAEGDYTLVFEVTCDEGVTTQCTAILHAVPIHCEQHEGDVAVLTETPYVVATIPIGASNVTIDMTCTTGTDIDLMVYHGATLVVGRGGLIDGAVGGSGTYSGDSITYTGYSGGDEVATINETSVEYWVKVKGFLPGHFVLNVCYYPPPV